MRYLHWRSTKVLGDTVVVRSLVSAGDFLLLCFLLMENQSLENQTRFCSLSLTGDDPLLVSRKRTLRNFPDLLTLLLRSFFTTLLLPWLELLESPHLQASSLPPMTNLTKFYVVTTWLSVINCNKMRIIFLEQLLLQQPSPCMQWLQLVLAAGSIIHINHQPSYDNILTWEVSELITGHWGRWMKGWSVSYVTDWSTEFTSLTGDCSMADHQMILIVHWIMQDLGLCDAENNICSGGDQWSVWVAQLHLGHWSRLSSAQVDTADTWHLHTGAHWTVVTRQHHTTTLSAPAQRGSGLYSDR